LAEAAFSLKVGEHSGVIETHDPPACYLMLVEDKRPAHFKALVKSVMKSKRSDARGKKPAGKTVDSETAQENVRPLLLLSVIRLRLTPARQVR